VSKGILNLIFSVLLGIPVFILEYFYFNESNWTFAIVSFLFISICLSIFLLNDPSSSIEYILGLWIPLVFYIIYWFHSWNGYIVLAILIVSFYIFGAILIFSYEYKNRDRKKFLKSIYPLQERDLTDEEIKILSSLYGENGHYYKVIKSGSITKRDADAINGKLRRELNIQKP
jgi:hypothetical protein